MPKETFLRLKTDKQERILRAAMRAFVDQGFSRAKVEDIARDAGVAKGSIYQYFADKAELFTYCSHWGIDQFMQKLDARTHLAEMDVFEYFLDSAGKTELLDEERELTLFLQCVANEPRLADASLKAMYEVGDAYGRQLIRNGKRKGSVRADIDDDLLLAYFWGVTERFERRWMSRYIDFSKEMSAESSRLMQEELTQMLTLMRNGMGC